MNKKALIEQANKDYYVKSSPTLSDAEFDALVASEESSQEYVGSDLSDDFTTIQHSSPMLSLAKTYSKADIAKWVSNHAHADGFVVEPKIDGVSLILYYNNNKLQYALTRGDGHYGNDVTENIADVSSIPHEIPYPGVLVVRGELCILKEDYKNLCNESSVSARNLANGFIHRKNKNTSGAPVTFITYECQAESSNKTHMQNYDLLQSSGFILNEHTIAYAPQDIIDAIQEHRDDYIYEIDGVVVKLNNIEYRVHLGNTAHHPRWAIAFKMSPESAQATITSIKTTVGRTGAVSWVAIITPVYLKGATITRVAVNSKKLLKIINVGATVDIERRGDVIPKIARVIQPGSGHSVQIDECPFCHQRLAEVGQKVFCMNTECPEVMIQKLKYLVSKDGLNIKGIGDKVIRDLYAGGVLARPADICFMSISDIMECGYSFKQASKILDAINKASAPIYKILSALSIPGLTKEATLKIPDALGDIGCIAYLSPHALHVTGSSAGIPEVTLNWLCDEDNQEDMVFIIKHFYHMPERL